MSELRFIEEGHIYLHGGKPIPGLTSIMAAEGYIKNSFYTEAGRERGTDVHRGCEDYDRGNMDWQRLSADQSPYVEAWAKYCDDYKFKPIRIEEPMHSHVYQFSTTPDVTGSDKDFEHVIVDRKTGSSEPWHPIQTAGQSIAYGESHFIAMAYHHRRSVILKPNGEYKVIEHKDKKDYEVAKAIFLIHHDKFNRGV